MKKIKKTIKAIASTLQNPWLLNHILSDDSVWKKYLLKKYKSHSVLPLVEIDELIPDFSETVSLTFLDGGSLPTDIALLKALCRKFHPCTYFEIGTWRGESVMNVSEVAAECFTLDLSKDELLKKGASEKQVSQLGFFSKGKANITHLCGNSSSFDFSTINKKFDVVFIDGDHHYDFVKKDTESIFRHLVHEHSIVVWHDYAFSPETIRHEVLAGILDGIPPAFRNNLYHVSNTLCAVFTCEKINKKELDVFGDPSKLFITHLESKKK